MTNKIFNVDDDLKIREELLSLHATNPFIAQTSSARSYMMSLHLSQSLPIFGGEEKIVQSGLEKQLGKNTFSKKPDDDFKVIKVIERYRGLSADSVNNVSHITIIGQNLTTGEYDAIELPNHNKVHNEFGFTYDWKTDILDKLKPNTIIPKDTILADSRAVDENNGYKFGINANLCLLGLPETAEDGMIVSESFAKKASYEVIEVRHIEFGSENFPLNIYGDENNYKPFPEIGEVVNEDSVLMVLRNYNSRLSHALTSKKDVLEYDPVFDKAIYVKGPGDVVDTSVGNILTSEIIDIKAYHCPKYKRDVLTGTINCVDKYVKGLKIYYNDILDTYNNITKEHYSRYRNNDVPVTNRFHRLLVEAMAVGRENDGKIAYSYRNESLDLYRISFTIVHRYNVCTSNKAADEYGRRQIKCAMIYS